MAFWYESRKMQWKEGGNRKKTSAYTLRLPSGAFSGGNSLAPFYAILFSTPLVRLLEPFATFSSCGLLVVPRKLVHDG